MVTSIQWFCSGIPAQPKYHNEGILPGYKFPYSNNLYKISTLVI